MNNHIAINIFLNKILEAGIYPDLQESEKKRIRLLNRLVFISILVTPPLALIDILNGYFITLWLYIPVYLVVIIEHFLVKNRKYLAAKYIIYFLFLFIEMLFVIMIGNVANLFVLVPFAMMPLLIFESKIVSFLLFVLLVLSYPLVYYSFGYFKPIAILNPSLKDYYLIIGSIFISLIVYLFSLYSRSINESYEKLILKEKQRSDDLLLNILPAEVAEELKDKGSAEAKFFDNVTVLFTDFKGFTTLAERLTPQQLVNELDYCFKGFDGIMAKYGIEKIKTVGDAYLAVAGLPAANLNHAENIIKAAIEIREFMKARKHQIQDRTFEIRIGAHSGSVVAGIVGVKKFSYDIWGDTVNTAARMEQNSEAGQINISQSTFELVKDKFNCIYRGEILAKNKGALGMYFVADQ